MLTVLATGVDSLYLSAHGVMRGEVVEALNAARERARSEREAVPFEFEGTGRTLLLNAAGLRGYPYWLRSADLELGLGRVKPETLLTVQLHSAYLHAEGPWGAVCETAELLRVGVLAGRPELKVSRVDLYADVQGWELGPEDATRFVCLGRERMTYQQETYSWGRQFTGFRFGRDRTVARVYDKTAEIARYGLSWVEEVWGEAREPGRVWRVEFQVRSEVLRRYDLLTVGDVLRRRQDLWQRLTETWLTYRKPTTDRRARRWPVDPVWREVQAVELAPTVAPLVRDRQAGAAEERALRGALGYVTSWAAMQ